MKCAITSSAKINYDPGGFVPQHSHSLTYQIQYIISGQADITIDNNTFRVSAGDIVFIKRGMHHNYNVLSDEAMSTLEVEFISNDESTCSFLAAINPYLKDTNGFIESLMRRIVREGQAKKYYFTEMANALLTVCLIGMFRFSEGPERTKLMEAIYENTSTSKVIIAATEYIYQNLNKNITISDLAKGCGYNKDYLYRTIKKEKGVSAIQYINNIRYEEACKMIATTELSISEISWKLGFDSIQYFSRFFKTRGVIRTDY